VSDAVTNAHNYFTVGAFLLKKIFRIVVGKLHGHIPAIQIKNYTHNSGNNTG
jgi:hypothetical protein